MQGYNILISRGNILLDAKTKMMANFHLKEEQILHQSHIISKSYKYQNLFGIYTIRLLPPIGITGKKTLKVKVQKCIVFVFKKL